MRTTPDIGTTKAAAAPASAVEGQLQEEPKDPDAPAPALMAIVRGPVSGESASVRSERLELYKLAVEMADRVSERRTNANNFFLALHAAFASIVTLFGLQVGTPAGSIPAQGSADQFGMIVIAVIGILLCGAWFLGLRSYRDLNSAKFKVINAIETELPVRVFSEEWRYLKEDKVPGWRGRYREQGTVERWVPTLFGIIYLIAGISAASR